MCKNVIKEELGQLKHFSDKSRFLRLQIDFSFFSVCFVINKSHITLSGVIRCKYRVI